MPDRRTDRKTDGRTDGQTEFSLLDRVCMHSMQRGKKYINENYEATCSVMNNTVTFSGTMEKVLNRPLNGFDNDENLQVNDISA